MDFDIAAARKAYREDGVVMIPGVLSGAALDAARASYEWSLDHPGPRASKIAQRGEGLFYQDLYNPDCLTGYCDMLLASPIPGIVAALWDTPDVWFMYEQVFLKEGGDTRRTPWHQDSSYLTIGGDDLAVAWITFDAQAQSESLEFIRGSHKGPLYDGSRFDIDDDTAPLYPGNALPRLPDIEKARDEYDIVSWAVAPGDVVFFHPKMLHGGAPTRKGARRRTLTLRFFGHSAVYERRPMRAGPPVASLHARLREGAPFRDDYFLKLLPR